MVAAGGCRAVPGGGEGAKEGATFLQEGIEGTTVTHLLYPENIHAHICVSWLHPFKEQRLVVIGQKGMLVFEDSAPQDKVRFYPKGFDSNGIAHCLVSGISYKFENKQVKEPAS